MKNQNQIFDAALTAEIKKLAKKLGIAVAKKKILKLHWEIEEAVLF